MPRMRSKQEMVMIMTDTVYVLNSHGVVDQVATVQVVMIEAVAIVVRLQNDHNIVFLCQDCHHLVRGKI